MPSASTPAALSATSRPKPGWPGRRWPSGTPDGCEDGENGLLDRSSRPVTCPNQTDPQVEDLVEYLRRNMKLGPVMLAGELPEFGVTLAASTIHRVLVRRGISRLRDLDVTGDLPDHPGIAPVPADVVPHGAEDVLERGGRAGEMQGCQVRRREHHPADDSSIALDEVDHAVRQPRFAQQLEREMGDQRGAFRRFPHQCCRAAPGRTRGGSSRRS